MSTKWIEICHVVLILWEKITFLIIPTSFSIHFFYKSYILAGICLLAIISGIYIVTLCYNVERIFRWHKRKHCRYCPCYDCDVCCYSLSSPIDTTNSWIFCYYDYMIGSGINLYYVGGYNDCYGASNSGGSFDCNGLDCNGGCWNQ